MSACFVRLFQRFSSLLRRLVGGFVRARSTDRGLVGCGAGPGLGLLPLLEVWVVEEVDVGRDVHDDDASLRCGRKGGGRRVQRRYERLPYSKPSPCFRRRPETASQSRDIRSMLTVRTLSHKNLDRIRFHTPSPPSGSFASKPAIFTCRIDNTSRRPVDTHRDDDAF